MNGVVPNDRAFEAAFAAATVTKAKFARYYLRVLERQQAGNPQPEMITNPNEEEVNLEHILPKSACENWPDFDADTLAANVDRIGNMALLKKSQNVSLGNAGFGVKRDVFEASSLLLTKSIARFDRWGPDQIDERQRELARLAVRAWPITD